MSYQLVGIIGRSDSNETVFVGGYVEPDDSIDDALETARDTARYLGLSKTLVMGGGSSVNEEQLATRLAEKLGNSAAEKQPEKPTEAIKEVHSIVRYTQYNKPDRVGNPPENPTTTAIGMYPAWNYDGKYGIYALTTHYLDKPEDVAEFERATGLKLSEMRESDLDSAPKRNYGTVKSWELQLATPIRIRVRIRYDVTPEGKERERYHFLGYEN